MVPLREEISKYLDRKFKLKYDPVGEVLVTVGGSEGIDLALRAMLDPGDEVLIPEPSFVSYKPCTTLAGGIAVPIPLQEKNEFRLTAEEIEQYVTDKTKAIIIPFPNNPTGAIMDKNDLEAVVKVILKYDLYVISDEIYAELTYGTKHISISSFEGMRERTVIINGYSKAYAMTGWRMGYAVGPNEFIEPMTRIHQYAIMCTPTTSQYAAIEASKNGDDDIEMMKRAYNQRRRFVVDGFRSIGLECLEPLGAFYVFPSIKKTGLTSMEFANKLLEEQEVAVVPGTAFGDSGEGFIRVSYAYGMETLKIALERISKFMEQYQ
jgi:aminotransferase